MREAIEDDVNTIEVGDMVDVDMTNLGTLPVRVIELVDDVEEHLGEPDPDNPDDVELKGPGFIGEIDPESGESGQMVFALSQVVPGSKAKYYFPHLGSANHAGRYDDSDEFGRDVVNPYRRMANREVVRSREPQGSYVSGLPDE